MKVTKYGIIFVIAIIPMIIVTWINTRFDIVSRRNEIYYNRIINTAVEDAAATLTIKTEHNSRITRQNSMSQYKDKVLETFFRTLYINFNVKENDIYRINTIKSYIPAMVFVDYDGYLIYAVAEYINANGAKEYSHIWYPKKGYTLEDEAGNLISFSLDSYINIYNENTKKVIEGYWEDIKDTSEILDIDSKDEFETIKRSCIISHIEKDLDYFVNKHNHFAKQNGIVYNFYFTEVPKDNWDRAIDDIGLIAFVQGIPVGVKQRFNSFAIGGSNILKKQKFVGFIDMDTNNKYYIRESELSSVNLSFDEDLIRIFDSMEEAAKRGYYPY